MAYKYEPSSLRHWYRSGILDYYIPVHSKTLVLGHKFYSSTIQCIQGYQSEAVIIQVIVDAGRLL